MLNESFLNGLTPACSRNTDTACSLKKLNSFLEDTLFMQFAGILKAIPLNEHNEPPNYDNESKFMNMHAENIKMFRQQDIYNAKAERGKPLLLKSKIKIILALSGGIDSTLAGVLMKKVIKDIGIEDKCELKAAVAGTEGCHDSKRAEIAACFLKLPLEKIIVTEEDMERDIPSLVKIIRLSGNRPDPMNVSYLYPLFAVCKSLAYSRAGEDNGIQFVLTGQGADELFGGYKRYMSMSKEKLALSSDNDYRTLLDEKIKADTSVCNYFSSYLLSPYLNYHLQEYINTAFSGERFCLSLSLLKECLSGEEISPVKKEDIDEGENEYKAVQQQFGMLSKPLLRAAGIKLGIPLDISLYPKKAAQYGSGIDKMLKKLAGKRKLRPSEYIGEIASLN